MDHQRIIVVGASAGGVEALRDLVGGLPRDLTAAICVVLHIGDRRSIVPELLSRSGPLPAAFAADGEPLQAGRIYMAPPDRHLLIRPGHVHLSRGPRENGTRPAVDPLFRSAAQAYGPAVIGVILSGMLSDGTAGFSAITHHGGTTVVQDPKDARCPSMPQSALRHVTVDHCVPASRMAGPLVRLLKARAPPKNAASVPETQTQDRAAEGGGAMEGDYQLKEPVALTCPGCGGAMKESKVDLLPLFTCHIGHRFAADNMEEAQFAMLEEALGGRPACAQRTRGALRAAGHRGNAEGADAPHAALAGGSPGGDGEGRSAAPLRPAGLAAPRLPRHRRRRTYGLKGRRRFRKSMRSPGATGRRLIVRPAGRRACLLVCVLDVAPGLFGSGPRL